MIDQETLALALMLLIAFLFLALIFSVCHAAWDVSRDPPKKKKPRRKSPRRTALKPTR